VTGAVRASAKTAFVESKEMILGESAAIPDLLAIADYLHPKHHHLIRINSTY
jgi:hypothetical protein